MIIYNADLIDGIITPSENGKLKVLCGKGIVRVLNSDGEKILNFKFKEDPRVERAKLIAYKANVEIDPNSLLCFPDERERTMEINRVEGKLFEDYIFNLLSEKFHVERQREQFISLSRITGMKYHNRPDFIVNGVVPVEAKVRSVNYEQIKEYSRLFKRGVVAVAFRSNCSVPNGWICVQDVVKDGTRLVSFIENLLSR